jgi:hypothetical protein
LIDAFFQSCFEPSTQKTFGFYGGINQRLFIRKNSFVLSHAKEVDSGTQQKEQE